VTREQVLARLIGTHAAFAYKVAAVPRDELETPTPGSAHSVKDILVHVAAYEELIVRRLRAARLGETTALDRDRIGWEPFNDAVWTQAAAMGTDEALERSAAAFAELLGEVERLTDAELSEMTGVTSAIDPAWLDGRALWEMIGMDAFEHYPMHFAAIDAMSGVDS
jgi:hypothetical protein